MGVTIGLAGSSGNVNIQVTKLVNPSIYLRASSRKLTIASTSSASFFCVISLLLSVSSILVSPSLSFATLSLSSSAVSLSTARPSNNNSVTFRLRNTGGKLPAPHIAVEGAASRSYP